MSRPSAGPEELQDSQELPVKAETEERLQAVAVELLLPEAPEVREVQASPADSSARASRQEVSIRVMHRGT